MYMQYHIIPSHMQAIALGTYNPRILRFHELCPMQQCMLLSTIRPHPLQELIIMTM